jgi:predicted TIM-barrel fold metal-dependent hydrolase
MMLDAIARLPVSDEQREDIRYRNAASLLGLDGPRAEGGGPIR